MKRIIFVLALLTAFAVNAKSQDAALGVRIGFNTKEISYQKSLSRAFFYEANAGLDTYRDETGGVAELLLNCIVARPSFTRRGDWNIYAGLGVAAGYVYDRSLSTFTYRDAFGGWTSTVNDRWGMGPMAGGAAQIGISYTFAFPLKLSLDVRPIIGLHYSERVHPDSDVSRLGIYGAGIRDCYPRLSVHYVF